MESPCPLLKSKSSPNIRLQVTDLTGKESLVFTAGEAGVARPRTLATQFARQVDNLGSGVAQWTLAT